MLTVSADDDRHSENYFIGYFYPASGSTATAAAAGDDDDGVASLEQQILENYEYFYDKIFNSSSWLSRSRRSTRVYSLPLTMKEIYFQKRSSSSYDHPVIQVLVDENGIRKKKGKSEKINFSFFSEIFSLANDSNDDDVYTFPFLLIRNAISNHYHLLERFLKQHVSFVTACS
jgi:hypothetical protein